MTIGSVGSLAARWARILSVGALALAPLGLTIWALWLLLQLAAFVGGLIAKPFLGVLARQSPELEAFLTEPFVAGAIALAAAIALLTLVGRFAGNFIGRQFGRLVAMVVERIPIARVIYSSARQLIDSFGSPAAAGQKVVLIEFPTESMRTVGLVTRTFRAEDTGQELAAVYVPTTPNPTSGYVEIVPVERLVWLDWTPSEAVQFIVSAGVVGPDRMRFKPQGLTKVTE